MFEKPKRTAAKAPVSAHPAFPAIVGLWFAALLGIGSFVLPVTVFEGLSTASGLSSVLIAAQPPLGVTARVLIALAAAGAGAVGGLLLARRIVASHAVHPQSQRAAAIDSDEASKKPISATEELGEDGIFADEDEFDFIPARRRDLAVHDECARSELPDLAPLPGIDPYAAPEPLDLGDFRAGTSVDAVAVTAEPEITAESGEEPTMSEPDFPAANFAVPVADKQFNAQPAPSSEIAAQATTDVPVSIVDLVDRFARALERHRELASTAPRADHTFAPGAKSQAEPGEGADDGAEDHAGELAEETYPSLLAMKSPFGLRETVRFGDEEDQTEDLAIEPVAVFRSQTAHRNASDSEGRVFGTAGARPFDGPAGRFQAKSGSSPAANAGTTEQALRDALEKLQRMSGAA